MKILIINPYYFPNNIGGTEIVINLLAEKLVERGNVVAVYTLDNTSNMLQNEKHNGVFIYRGCGGKYKLPLNKLNKIDRINNAIIQRVNLTVRKEVQKVIDVFKPEVVNTHNLYGFSTVVWRIVKKNNIPLVHTLNDSWLLKKTVFPFALINSREVDFVVAPSNFTLSLHMKKLFDAEHKVIANGIKIDEKHFEHYLSEKMQREEQNVIFMFAGQLEKFKGIDKLLEEFHNCPHSGIELHIYGRGQLKNMVEDFSRQDCRIMYHGFATSQQMEQAYKSADVLVVPSVWQETFGMVAIEAYYHALPVIAADRGGLKEVVKTIGAGKLIDPEKKASIHNALSYYIDRKNIKKDAMLIKKNICIYNIDYQVDKYLDIFDTLANNVS